MGNLGKLKADGAEKDLLIAELHSKLSKLVCERDEKSSTLKASQDKNALQSLLEPTSSCFTCYYDSPAQLKNKKT